MPTTAPSGVILGSDCVYCVVVRRTMVQATTQEAAGCKASGWCGRVEGANRDRGEQRASGWRPRRPRRAGIAPARRTGDGSAGHILC